MGTIRASEIVEVLKLNMSVVTAISPAGASARKGRVIVISSDVCSCCEQSNEKDI